MVHGDPRPVNPDPFRAPLPSDPIRLAADVDALGDPDAWAAAMDSLARLRWSLERSPADSTDVPALEALTRRLDSANLRTRGQALALRVMRADLRRCLYRRGARRPAWAEAVCR